MVQSNKVLTVSYGTFSCTLEGFEDSFDTMKAIAEYFRDLAADDRYFGAEPPQPDAEMLARIAQREVARQVEAHTGADGIHLRAASAHAAPTATQTAAQTTAPQAVETPEPTPEPTPTPDVVAAVAAAPKITAAASTAPTIETEAETAADAAPLAETEVSALAYDPSSDETSQPKDVAPTDLDDEITPEGLSEPEEIKADLPPETRELDQSTTDRIAAKLKLIRSVVSKTPEPTDGFIEDEHAESFADVDGEDLNLDQTEAPASEASEDAGNVADNASSAQEDDALAAAVRSLTFTGSQDSQDSQDTPQEDLASPEIADASRTPETPPQADPTAPQEAASSSIDEPAQEAASDTLSEAAQSDAPVRQSAALPHPAERPVRGRIIRVKRAQLEEGVLDISATEVSQPTVDDGPVAVSSAKRPALPLEADHPFNNSSLPEDDEADLLAELAAVEAELMASSRIADEEGSDAEDILEMPSTQMPAPDTATDTAPVSSPAEEPKNLAEAQNSPDGDVSRLMEAAADRLNAEDAAASRATYNQLRAAVAAAKSDTNAEDASLEEAKARAFREDLEDVVRPRRPVSGRSASTTERGQSTARPTPLKLVAEQRVDAAPESQTGTVIDPTAHPVRPRRVRNSELASSGSSAAEQDDTAFATYAEDLGAVEMHELLEAAASYLSFVEGRASFSRPQLINKVRTIRDHQDFSREDSLRIFGQLLREGKLERSSNGRFTASSHIGFRPDGRAAG